MNLMSVGQGHKICCENVLIVNIQEELGLMCGVDIIRKEMSHICLKLIVLILGGGMMRYELNFDEDKVNDVLDDCGASYDLKGCCELLNEQQYLLNHQNELLDEIFTIFQRYGIDTGYNKRILEIALENLTNGDD